MAITKICSNCGSIQPAAAARCSRCGGSSLRDDDRARPPTGPAMPSQSGPIKTPQGY